MNINKPKVVGTELSRDEYMAFNMNHEYQITQYSAEKIHNVMWIVVALLSFMVIGIVLAGKKMLKNRKFINKRSVENVYKSNGSYDITFVRSIVVEALEAIDATYYGYTE